MDLFNDCVGGLQPNRICGSITWNSSCGWLDLLSIQFVLLEEAGLAMDSSDRLIWQFAQANQMLLLTANRNAKGEDSLEQTIQ